MYSKFDPYVRYIAKTKYFINDKVVAKDHRILYILGGHGSFESDEGIFSLETDNLIYYPAGHPYRIRSYEDLVFYTINFDFTQEHHHIKVIEPQPAKDFHSDTITIYDPREEIPFNNIIYLQNAVHLKYDIENIYHENVSIYENHEIMSMYMNIILKKLERGIKENKELSPLCKNIKKIVFESPTLNIKEIAERLRYHPYYLNAVFQNSTGSTLHKYISDHRLNLCKELLLTTELSLEEIALTCGYCSQSHMSSAFKKAYGITPGNLRKKL